MTLLNVSPFIFQSLLKSALEVTALVYFLLAAHYAARRRGGGVTWIMSMVIGFGLRLFCDLFQLSYWTQRQTSASPRFWPPWTIDIPQYVYLLSLAFFALGAFRLWQTMRQVDGNPKAATFVPAAPQEGVWPPPPSGRGPEGPG